MTAICSTICTIKEQLLSQYLKCQSGKVYYNILNYKRIFNQTFYILRRLNLSRCAKEKKKRIEEIIYIFNYKFWKIIFSSTNIWTKVYILNIYKNFHQQVCNQLNINWKQTMKAMSSCGTVIRRWCIRKLTT